MERLKVDIVTDGACSGNPGPGGYAAKLIFGNKFKEIAGYESRTTNNRMELLAVNEGIRKLKKPCSILVKTDSQTVCNAIANRELRAKNGWKTKSGALCANVDLLQQMHDLVVEGDHELSAQYIPGHSGISDNERCDYLAKEAIRVKGDPLGV